MASKRKSGTLDAFFRPTQTAAKAQRLNEHDSSTSKPTNDVLEFSTAFASSSRSSTALQDPSSSTPEPSAPATPPNPPSTHPNYPHPISSLPLEIQSILSDPTQTPPPGKVPRTINDKPSLDLLYYSPFIPRSIHGQLFQFLRAELPFYRVRYKIKRGGVETEVNTPRFTTVFGVDETSSFTPTPPCPDPHAKAPDSAPNSMKNEAPKLENSSATIPSTLLETSTHRPVLNSKYACKPRPIPSCLDTLRIATEKATGCTFNFCLVNYYATGADSISFHADDEKFLGPQPAIASFSLGAGRDFVLKRKPMDERPAGVKVRGGSGGGTQAKSNAADDKVKLPLNSGDMVLMRGRTQAGWLHSIPKRAGMGEREGRINITFRKALVKGGTDNYYQYNVGNGPVYRWNHNAGEMRIQTAPYE
ncbi:MAG: hypothetical protein M1831_000657 [Alyxoria varia]|nr:MAG: hypothetical protein M1831_000657 [Alyxoria varia]